ncbi:MAG: DnaJ domain-containing protein [Campylobacterales bacterium]|nr:DnaJ domain-containing protein [Campylobacterales bacterium]
MSQLKNKLEVALETLSLPKLITKDDIKKRYRYLAKKLHPDKGGDEKQMAEINEAYEMLMEYIDSFRYSFDDREIEKHTPGESHTDRFRP